MKKIIVCLIIIFTILQLFACDNIQNVKNNDGSTTDSEDVSQDVEDNENSAIVAPSDSESVAQIVIDYEEMMKSKINELNVEHPEYNYFYNPVDKIWCAFVLESSASAEDIIEKYDMYNIFAEADVSPNNTSKMISINFDRDDFTESMHQKIKQINDEEPFIERYFIEMIRYIDKSYMPAIDYYADNATPIDYEQLNNVINLKNDEDFIIKSKREYDDYINNLLQTESSDYLREIINEQKDLYDASFFLNNALIITKKITRSSGSISLTINDLYISDNKVYVVVKTDVPMAGTDDMQYRTFAIKVSKIDVINVTEVITLE